MTSIRTIRLNLKRSFRDKHGALPGAPESVPAGKQLPKDSSRIVFVEDVLSQIYFDCEFIDPVQEIIEKIINTEAPPVSIPYGIFAGETPVGFFTVDLSNPPVPYDPQNPRCCWLDSFIIGLRFQRKGYAATLIARLPGLLAEDFPCMEKMNLTVNFRNKGARALYLKCGFKDTGEVYTGGPSGPQYIFTLPVVDLGNN